MHDPSFVAAEIVRPWPSRSRWHDAKHEQSRWQWDRYPQRKWWRPNAWSRFCTFAGRGYFWPALITIWHNEPDGRDAGEVCGYPHGRKLLRHLRHLSVQVHPWGHFLRWAFTRCAWCGGKSRKGDYVNCSLQWDGPRAKHWWQGEPALFHGDCSSVYSAHRACTCDDPLLDHDGYGRCAFCSGLRAWRAADDDWSAGREATVIIKAEIAKGGRMTPAVRARTEALWKQQHEHDEARRKATT